MMRIISILLLLGGLAAAGVGGAALLENYAPREAMPTTIGAPPAPPPPAPATSEPVPEMPAPPPEEATPSEAAPSEAAGIEAAPAPEADTEEQASIMAAPSEEDSFNFQPMVEEPAPEARAMRSAPADAPAEAGADAPEAVDIDDPNVTAAVSESFIDTLKTVPVAHETPASAEYKRPFNVTFAIDATGDSTAVDALPGRGVIEEGTARVSDRVEVRLSGASFQIEQTSPPVQSLSPLTENTWRWSVMPLTAGDHDLTFEIFAVDADEVVPLRTYRDTVTVRVSGLNRAIAFADQANPLFVLLGGLGSILAGILGVARFVLKK